MEITHLNHRQASVFFLFKLDEKKKTLERYLIGNTNHCRGPYFPLTSVNSRINEKKIKWRNVKMNLDLRQKSPKY